MYLWPTTALGGPDWPINAWRDLSGETASVEGPVEDKRHHHKPASGVGQSRSNEVNEYFLVVDGQEFRVSSDQYDIAEIGEPVTVVYYPHTGFPAEVSG